MSAPSAREMLDNAQEAVRRITSGMAPMRIPADPADADRVLSVLAARVEAVLAMHHPSHDRDGKPVGVCADCGWSVPCPTVRALDGGQA